jgi:polysaccharide deacetylase 2 family uncharacterized protein YibQ
MARAALPSLPLNHGLVLWGSLSALLFVGFVASTIGFIGSGTAESLRANMHGQRAVGDPKTGHLTLATIGKKVVEEKFDVTTPEEKKFDVAAPTDAAATPQVDAPPSQGETLPEGLPELRTEPLTDKLPDSGASATDSLVPAPAPEITETVDGMALPKRTSEKAGANTLYARRFTRTPEQHLLSIVILDAGISVQSLPLMMSLPKNITIAFSPYTENAAGRIATLRHAGYEAWAMLPAMSTRYPQDDPGPLGLVAALPKDELMRRLRVVMAETIGSAGMLLPLGDILSTKAEPYAQLTSEIETRGLYLLAANPTATPEQRAAEKKQKAFMRRADLVLDHELDPAAMEAALSKLAEDIKTKETMIVVTSARPQSLLLLQRWLTDHPLTEPAVLAPLSAQWLPKEVPPLPAAETSDSHGGGHGGGEKKDAKKSSGGH